MKHWFRSTPGKAVCFILCILMLVAAAAGILGGIAMITAKFYYTPVEVMTDQLHRSMARSEADDLLTSIAIGNYTNRFDAQYTNLRYKVVSAEGKTVDTNISGKPEKAWQYAFCMAEEDHYYVQSISPDSDPVPDSLTVYLYLEPDLPVADRYTFIGNLLQTAYALRYWIWVIAGGALLLCILFFILLMCGAARRPHSGELHPGPLYRVPFDLLVFLTLTFLLLVYAIAEDSYYYSPAAVITCTVLLVLTCISAVIGLCMSMAARVKAGTLLKNTLIGHICRLIAKTARYLAVLVRGLPLIWRTVLIVAALVFTDTVTLVFSFGRSDAAILFWFLQNIILAGALLYAALFMRRLQAGSAALARGDLSYKIDTSIMFWDFKQHGENLNSIAGGMTAAVEQRLRSERMRTELITNVSHDIKTPLTSIINYATLISEEPCECSHHREYSQVLVRKSDHLRRLLDDLVEASRASTGNLDVSLAPCEAGVLLTQAAGEYAERCAAAGLELVTSQPEQPVMILADSRRIWRIFENLMNNVCKYSLSGTRVFLRLETEGRDAVFTLRNTSSAVLDVSPDALMERFVRGDASRSTEGSGLGLSIAQSLTQLQNGRMDISIDGDMFKVTLRFPLA